METTTETKTKTKNREWVKNAAIIFLAVLLVLTFFSNTILNASLPEVATRGARGGTITARIRVTGNVTASQNYEVSIDESRRVRSVLVKTGQEVSAGDVLFVLSEGESDELESARDTLRELQKSYQEKLISSAGNDYARETRDIRLAQQELTEAERTLLGYGYGRETEDWAYLAAEGAKAAVTAADTRLDAAQRALDKAEEDLNDLGEKPTADSIETLRRTMETKRTALYDGKAALEASRIIYGDQYDWIEGRAEQMIRQTDEYKALEGDRAAQQEFLERSRATYEDRVIYLISESLLIPPGVSTSTVPGWDGSETIIDPVDLELFTKAYEEVSQKRDAAAEVQEAYDDAREAYDKALAKYDEYQRLQQAYDAAAAEKKEADRLLTEAKEDQATVESAVEKVKSAEKSLEDLVFALEEAQRSDGRQSQMDALALQDLAAQIEKARKRVDEFSEGTAETEVKADVGGVVASIAVTAGQTTTPMSPMATIELPDMGYLLTATVTNDQARRLHVGDSATVANAYWGSQIDATLTGVSADPRDPQNSKQLTFELRGDVTAGGSLTLSVGERSAEYDLVVPNSALRSDANGDFVLVVSAKSSPLGDRYTATRVEVTKLANDDTNTAVTGALEAGDFIITTSTAPIKNGDRVRLADTQDGAT